MKREEFEDMLFCFGLENGLSPEKIAEINAALRLMLEHENVGISPIVDRSTDTDYISDRKNMIESFYHCGLCLAELPEDMSPREFAQLEVGATEYGYQIWCKRHECNVTHIDFEGMHHPARCTRYDPTPDCGEQVNS